MAKIPIILEAGRADGKLIKTNSVYDDNQEKFLSDKIKEIDNNHNELNDTVNDLTDIVNNNELDVKNKLEAEQIRATNAENNLRETINNITEISGNSTSANIVTIANIPNSSSSNVQQALNELFKNNEGLNTDIKAETARAIAAEKAIIFDVSEHNNGVVFESLLSLLSDSNLSTLIPTSVRHGGMSIRFIQGSEHSSDNKYVQYRLMTTYWSTIVTNWQYIGDEVLINSPEWLYFIADKDDKILAGIKADGSIEWSLGVPKPIKDALNKKLDKSDERVLVDVDIANSFNYTKDPENVFLLTSNGYKLLAINGEGEIDIPNLLQYKSIEANIRSIKDLLNVDSTIVPTQYQELVEEIESAEADVTYPTITADTELFVINIMSQSEFDDIVARVNAAIEANHNNIVIRFSSGTFYYSEKHIHLSNSSSATKIRVNSSVNITICGENTTLIAKGTSYSITDEGAVLLKDYWKVGYTGAFDARYGMVDREGNVVDVLNQNRFEVALSGVTSDGNSGFKIAVDGLNDISAENVGETKVLITSGWDAFLANVTKIETTEGIQYIYFTTGRTLADANRDKENYGTNPRYKLVNNKGYNNIFVDNGFIYIPYRYDYLYESRCNTFLYVDSVSPNSIEISGLNFVSNSAKLYEGVSPSVGRMGVIWMYKSSPTSHIRICGNSFNGIKSPSFWAQTSDNIYISNNKWHYCYSSCLSVNHDCSNIIVQDNTFNKIGYSFSQSHTVSVRGHGFIIKNNIFTDLIYSAITTGTWFESTGLDSSGIIEKNIIYNTKEFSQDVSQNALMDGAPIYVCSKNNYTVIRYNIIYDILPYKKRYNGIYVDGGGHGYKIYQNIVLGGFNYSLYQEWWGDLIGNGISNTNNVWLYNIVDSKIYINGNALETETSTSYKGVNFLLYEYVKQSRSVKFINSEDDIYIKNLGIKDGIVFVTESVNSQLNKILNKYISNKIYTKY